MKPYPNEELDRMSKREIIRLYKRTVEQFNDAVPVIRCKDCMFYGKELEACWESEYEDLRRWKPDDFCSKGERKRRMKEVIVNAEDLVCLNKEKLQEIIRCKDCRWYVHSGGVCKLHSNNYEPSVKMETDDFCSRAKRKDNG